MSSANEFKPALIVVDMQHDVVYGSLPVPEAATIVDTINRLLDLPFVKKVATKDYHPPGHISFAATHDKPEFSTLTIYPPGEEKDESRALEQILWPVHCVESTPGSEFVDKLHSDAFDAVIHKGTHPGIDSYSGFQDPWKIAITELPRLFSESGVTDVYVCGVAGDYCIKCTAFDAVEFGYKTWVVEDAVKSMYNFGTEWKEMENGGIHTITSDELIQKLA